MTKGTNSLRRPTTDGDESVERSDEELLLQYRETDDREAFEQLVHRYERELYSYLRRYLGDASQAEDTFQTTFLQVHLNRDQFEEGRKFRPWLYTIATNQAIDSQRRGKRHRSVSLDRGSRNGEDETGSLGSLLESREPDPEDSLESTQQRDWIRKAVEDLPESLQSVVTLVYYQGLKYREAADILNIPVGTVKSRMHTAVVKLNEVWRESQDVQG